ncbi:D-amino acid dehydrogenase [Thiothrix litoralis]|jgi:D-amino-acid dehydrogenase|uniref:D-amino acid dehydrogenase n=1 Tax=Thiothrix litoralis TaxID=2891210 RepID=A0ABX7X3K4_9GAMM|nr:D-amino acid dehydrogenase [Thiothrix litoralis]QTR47700.1 D-amino acid dehydrogenase [Thiothrix litoralis]
MKVLVLGGGVIGVSTAYYLAKAGHEVQLVERQSEVAFETSHANAGQISPGYSAPWAAPGIPLKALHWMLMEHSPLHVYPHLDWAMWRWLGAFLRNCTLSRYQLNKARMVRLAEYSRDCLRELRAETGIRYDERSLGTLQLFRTQQQLDGIHKDAAILQAQGVPFNILDREGVIRHEPALAQVQHKYVGGLHLPDDETGDCFRFTQTLSGMAEQMGVIFHCNTTVQGLVASGQTLSCVQTSKGLMQADAYVLALGSHSPLLLKPLGIRLPIYPVKGYSLTVPITHPEHAPESTVMDETHKVAITRLGERIRLGGTAELNGFDLSLPAKRLATLQYVLSDLFPNGSDPSKASFWAGLRPMTPDGTPILGKTPYSGLFLNTGHGTLGWTMAAGSGRILAAMLSGQTADIALEGLGMERYG